MDEAGWQDFAQLKGSVWQKKTFSFYFNEKDMF